MSEDILKFDEAMLSIVELVYTPFNGVNSIYIDKLLPLIYKAYIPVSWPYSQLLMEYNWFDTECILDTNYITSDQSSTYLVPIQRLMELDIDLGL